MQFHRIGLYLRVGVSVLTFGCDGARAAAPIANARTAFILIAQTSSQMRVLHQQAASLAARTKSHFHHSGDSQPTLELISALARALEAKSPHLAGFYHLRFFKALRPITQLIGLNNHD